MMTYRALMDAVTTSRWVMPVVLGMLHLCLGLAAFNPAPPTGGDDATYVALARSLIERHDYTSIGEPGLGPHTQYPPVFPAIVAIGLGAGMSPDFGLRILAIVISAVAVVVSCLWLRRVATPGVAVAAGFFIAVSPEILRLSSVVLSDAAFWLFSILALLAWRLAAERTVKPPDRGRTAMPIEWVVAASVATVLAHFTRAAGAPLLFGAFIWLAMLRQRRAILVLGGISIPLIFMWWYRGSVVGSEGYLDAFLNVDPYNPSLGQADPVELIKRVSANVSAYTSRQLPRLALGTPVPGLAFGMALTAAALYSWTRRVRKTSLAEVWFPLYLALVLLWPVTWSGARFLLPIVPLIALYATETVAGLVRRGTYPRLYAALAFAAMAFAVRPALMNQLSYAAGCRREVEAGNVFPCTDGPTRDFLVTARNARGKLSDGAVVLSRKPTLFYHYSGYRSTPYPMYTAPDSLFALIERTGADYVVSDRLSALAARYLDPVLASHRESFREIPELSTETTTFYRIESTPRL